MKKLQSLNDSLFLNFEGDKITNLTKIAGGVAQDTTYKSSNGTSGTDKVDVDTHDGFDSTKLFTVKLDGKVVDYKHTSIGVVIGLPGAVLDSETTI